MTSPGSAGTLQSDLLKRAVATRGDVEEIFLVPVLAVAVAILLGGVIMLATGIEPARIGEAFAALFTGSVGSVYALSETLTAAAPVTLAALGVALAFRAGLFNIGAEGQILMGGMAAAIVGFAVTGLPAPLHLGLSLLAAALVGALWGAFAGFLKAATGAHEVITTIMLNLISFRLIDYLLRTPPIQRAGRADPISETILPSADLPRLLTAIDPNLRLHAGFLIAIVLVVAVYYLLFRTARGFEFRAVGLNPDAARYAGMRSGLIIIAAMAIAGGLAGLAGANQILGVLDRASPGFSSNIGFDAIAVALLGRSHPVGVLFAGLLFGALEAGGRQMQVSAAVSIDLIAIIQALIIVFIAAPALVRFLFPFAFRREVRR
jgi:simple sugar transport system permease protein